MWEDTGIIYRMKFTVFATEPLFTIDWDALLSILIEFIYKISITIICLRYDFIAFQSIQIFVRYIQTAVELAAIWQ